MLVLGLLFFFLFYEDPDDIESIPMPTSSEFITSALTRVTM